MPNLQGALVVLSRVSLVRLWISRLLQQVHRNVSNFCVCPTETTDMSMRPPMPMSRKSKQGVSKEGSNMQKGVTRRGFSKNQRGSPLSKTSCGRTVVARDVVQASQSCTGLGGLRASPIARLSAFRCASVAKAVELA